MARVCSVLNRASAARTAAALSIALSFALSVFAVALSPRALQASDVGVASTGDVSGTVTDSANGGPLASVQIVVSRDGKVVTNRLTDALGRYTAHNLSPGTYSIEARFIGYRPATRTVMVATADQTGIDFTLAPATVTLQTVQVSAAAPVALDTRSADQVFDAAKAQLPPVATASQVLQTSIAGAARAPTGEVHIRGQHAEYTYYIDGVPVPSGVSGSLNETFDPKVLEKMEFQTGGWDAEYGNKNVAVINVATRIPSGGFHANLSTYVGTYDTKSTAGNHNLDGQSAAVSTNSGPWGFYLSGSRQYSDMRQEPVIFDTTTQKVQNFHNSGFDYYGFGKVQYSPSANDVATLDLNLSQTLFAIPYDSSGNVFADDHQQDVNAFVNLSWHHLFGVSAISSANQPELFGGLFYRHGSLRFTPSPRDSAIFVFFPDTTTAYNLSENRHFDTYGAKLDYTLHPADKVDLKFGTTVSTTTGHEDFSAITSKGQLGPTSNSGLSGNDVGVYGQTAISPVEWFELRTGVRYDAHTAPFAGTQSQVSPRVRLNFYPAAGASVYLYYGRMFIPTNVEDLRAITSAALGAATTPLPTLPERDNFYEVGWAQRWAGILSTKFSFYKKDSSPGVDDNTVPGSSIITEVNIDHIHVQGVESVIELTPSGPFSAFVNAALNHAWGLGPVTGGFFPVALPPGAFDLDHDQRLSITAGGSYAVQRFSFTATETYGSGLITTPCSTGCPYGTGLFDWNSGYHVKPNYTTDASASYSIVSRGTIIRPQLYVTNLFNKQYLLKGAFFSGAWVGRPRSIQLKVNVEM